MQRNCPFVLSEVTASNVPANASNRIFINTLKPLGFGIRIALDDVGGIGHPVGKRNVKSIDEGDLQMHIDRTTPTSTKVIPLAPRRTSSGSTYIFTWSLINCLRAYTVMLKRVK
jgi:hypothetical protein